jgi:hypothetical protein
MLLAEQPVHQRFVRPGPLVLGSKLLKSPTPTADRDRTVSRRSEPRSRTALMGEQPNPWDLLQPQDATIRHRGAKPPRRCGVLQSLAAQTIPSSLSRALRIMNAIDLHPYRCSTSISRVTREVVTGRACIAYPVCGGPCPILIVITIPNLARMRPESSSVSSTVKHSLYDKLSSLGIAPPRGVSPI